MSEGKPHLEQVSAETTPASIPLQGTTGLARVLVVDDEFDVAVSMTWLLEGLARDIRAAHGGEAALELAREFKPELVLCDISMLDMDGYETCRRFRQLAGLEKTVLVAMSGYGRPEDQKKSEEAGFDRHLVKPFTRATLEELIESLAKIE